MDPAAFAATFELEADHWWFRGLRRFLGGLLAADGTAPGGLQALDVGCGGGMNAAWLAERGAEVTALDLSPLALEQARRRGARRLVRASANALPLAGESFDLVVSVDLLETSGVDQPRAVAEMARVLRAGGTLLVWAAAFPWLSGPHDRAVASTQRLTRAGLVGLVRSAGLEVLQAGYLYRLLFPVLAGRKLLGRIGAARSADLRPLPRALDRLLDGACRAEARLLPSPGRLPGTSVAVLARKGAR